MMRLSRHDSPAAFHAAIAPLMERTEAENNLLVGILGNILDHPEAYGGQPPLLLTLAERGQVCSALLCTPPWGPVITAAREQEVLAMVEQVAEVLPGIPTVVGPRPAVDFFARVWSERTGNVDREER